MEEMTRKNHRPPPMPGILWLALLLFAFWACYEASQTAWGLGLEVGRRQTISEETREWVCRRREQISSLADVLQTRNPKLYRARAEHYAFLIYEECEKQGVGHLLLASLIIQETGVREEATGGAGEIGLMQILPWWLTKAEVLGLDPITPRELYDPVNNIRWGVAILKRCLINSNGDIHRALCWYNAGPNWKNGIKYADSVLRIRSKLEKEIQEARSRG